MHVTLGAFSSKASPGLDPGVETGSRDETSVPIQSEQQVQAQARAVFALAS
jgi:hypothetical protein